MLVLKGVLEKKLQEAEVKLSSICKEREEAEERHQVEISVSITQTPEQFWGAEPNRTAEPTSDFPCKLRLRLTFRSTSRS